MELFTFIETGGARERISVVELEEGVSAALAKFDGAKANCFLPKDKQKLVAVIEAGFGDMAHFNKVVRKILTERVEVVVERKRRLSSGLQSAAEVPDAQLYSDTGDVVAPAVIELTQIS